MEKKNISADVTVTVREYPARKLMILRSVKAVDYFSYCEENGCSWEETLNNIPEKLDTAALITLPERMIPDGTSATVSGIELPADYSGIIPENYEIIDLLPCKMLCFNGMPYENEEDFKTAIKILEDAVKNYKPEFLGYEYADGAAPSFNYGASAKNGAKVKRPVKAAGHQRTDIINILQSDKK